MTDERSKRVLTVFLGILRHFKHYIPLYNSLKASFLKFRNHFNNRYYLFIYNLGVNI